MEITSLDNAKVKLWNSLKIKKNRDKYGLFIVEEKHMIEEAISGGLLDTLIVRMGVENKFSKEAVYVSDAVMKKLSEHVSLDDYLAICKMPENEIKNYNSLIVLERVQDPGNLGTIIRTAYSFGYDGILLSNDCVDVYNEKSIQASQGAIFHLPIMRKSMDEIIELCHKNGCVLVGTDLHNSSYLKDMVYPEKYALLFGNEGNGVKRETIEKCDKLVKIEMANFESLNVAIAAGILAYNFKYHK